MRTARAAAAAAANPSAAGASPAGACPTGASPTGASPAAADEEFIRQAYQAHAVGLVRVAVLLLGDQPSAEDVVQDAFFSLYKTLPRVRDRARVLAYLRTSVINGCRSVHRSRKRALLRGVQHDPPVWSAESAAMAGEERRELLAAVARQPRRAREILALRFYVELSDQEIATTLGISRGTVSSTASRARAALARELKEQQ